MNYVVVTFNRGNTLTVSEVVGPFTTKEAAEKFGVDCYGERELNEYGIRCNDDGEPLYVVQPLKRAS